MPSALDIAAFWAIVLAASTVLVRGLWLVRRRKFALTGAFEGFGRTERALVQVVAFGPLVWVVGFALLVIRVRLTVGEWPHPRGFGPGLVGMIEPSIDPKQMTLHWAALVISLGIFMLTAIAVLILALALRAWRRRDERTMCGVYFTGCSLIALILFVDPGRYWLWFMD